MTSYITCINEKKFYKFTEPEITQTDITEVCKLFNVDIEVACLKYEGSPVVIGDSSFPGDYVLEISAIGRLRSLGVKPTQWSLLKSTNNEVTKLLLEIGINPNSKDFYGRPAVVHAVETLNIEKLECLLIHGAKPDAVSPLNETAMITAITLYNLDMVKILHKYGANINVQNSFGETPLMYAAQLDEAYHILQFLVDIGADLDVKSFDGLTALDYTSKGSKSYRYLKKNSSKYTS